MQFFRQLLKRRRLASILLVGMLARSSIATGYMLDSNPADGSLFTITICEGPAGINAIEGLSEQHHDHSQHHNHHHEDHEHAVQDHVFSACSFWSSSSQSILADLSIAEFSEFFLFDEAIVYKKHIFHRISFNKRFARAPPLLLS